MFKQYAEFLESHKYPITTVPVDKNHASLLFSTAICQKPKTMLELGMGSALLTNTLIAAKLYNGNGVITSVDSFYDWDGKEPEHLKYIRESTFVNVVIKDEKDFVLNCQEKYDLVVVDGNHNEGHLWADKIFDLVNQGGILFAHDVLSYPNLGIYMQIAEQRGYGYKVYSQSSRPDEACNRGFIQVFVG